MVLTICFHKIMYELAEQQVEVCHFGWKIQTKLEHEQLCYDGDEHVTITFIRIQKAITDQTTCFGYVDQIGILLQM